MQASRAASDSVKYALSLVPPFCHSFVTLTAHALCAFLCLGIDPLRNQPILNVLASLQFELQFPLGFAQRRFPLLVASF
jgi:hypothetical protein